MVLLDTVSVGVALRLCIRRVTRGLVALLPRCRWTELWRDDREEKKGLQHYCQVESQSDGLRLHTHDRPQMCIRVFVYLDTTQ